MATEGVRFVIEAVDDGDVLVRVAASCAGDTRADEDKRALEDALSACRGTLAIDLSETVACTSLWLRFFYGLTIQAQEMGKRVVLVGLRDVVQETTDALALKGKLVVARTVAEAWAK